MYIDAPKIAKGYTVHIVFLTCALLVSAMMSIWNMEVGQQLRGAILTLFYCFYSV